MIVESYLHEKLNGDVRCKTCMHYCILKEGQWGICRVRKNSSGKLEVHNYGLISAIHLDPIEKKPFHNFMPGSKALSLGSVSCNFRCRHCQNYEISFADLSFPYLRELTPEEVSRLAESYGADGISWTYNEPAIMHEFALDASRIAKKKGYYITYVSNGYMSHEAIEQFDVLDAVNVDVKAFNEEFYRKICKARLSRVTECVEHLSERGIFIEITYLIIPGHNDDEKELKKFARWVSGLNPRIPVHFSRFHPDFQMLDVPPTPVKTIERAISIARDEGLEYIYAGNVWGHRYENTYCPSCGELLIAREGFHVREINLKGDKCPNCGYRQNIVLK
ncbi:AmmeMemoRadiSam system radical SAM enzyme [Geoglobus acetivorans]|uniref:Pyruvate formate-lyase activating enzyme n=1 Tax=Geoglobus acetivorans TaxID=565033 RepID=A0A0A7GEX1_GEOAI|nr:pyruvate formate-lyase activating enzyme [Geoglobus acetivorans]